MNFKSLVVAVGISLSGLSASEIAQVDSLTELTVGFSEGTKTAVDVNQYVKELQTEIYDLIDEGNVVRAEERFDTAFESLSQIYDQMSEEDHFSSGAETMSLIANYILIHSAASK